MKSNYNVQQTSLSGVSVEHPCLTKVGQQSVTKLKPLTVINLVAPVAEAKQELLLNKLAYEVGLLKT